MAHSIEIQREFPETILSRLGEDGESGLIPARWTWRLNDPFVVVIEYGPDLVGSTVEWVHAIDFIRAAVDDPGDVVGKYNYTVQVKDEELVIALANPDRLCEASFPLDQVVDFLDSVKKLDDPAHYRIEEELDRILGAILGEDAA